ncbi:protein MCM10 homolog [Asterias amurensis]|uniref:protein MCM10 homolog n=1 Tax=Asterias amurensis TaxID=7602 RepID=UPI003AB7D885
MSDDEYAYGDIDELTALLDDEDEKDPYQDDVPTCATKKYTYNPSLEDLSSKSQQSSQKPAESTSDHQRSTQVASSGQVSSQGQGSLPGQRPSSCEDDVSDEAKSKEELMDELKRMREQMKLMQSGGSSQTGSDNQTSGPRETFSDAISVTVEVKHVRKQKTSLTDKKTSPKEKKPSPAEKKTSPGDSKRYTAQEIGSIADLTAIPSLSNPEDWDDDWDDDDWDEVEEKKEASPAAEPKSALFGKSAKRVAHTPNNNVKKPDKVSPYKCELCHEVLDTLEALTLHTFQHRKESPQDCAICGKSFANKYKLQAHARIHGTSAQSTSSSARKASAGSAQLRRESGNNSRGQASKTGKPEKKEHIETNKHSQLRVLNPLVSSTRLDSMMDGRKMLRLSILKNYLGAGGIEGDWVTMGVLVAKLPPKTSSKGKAFSIWKLSDLSNCEQVTTLFLFGKSHDEHWKTAQGSVLGILNASIMPPKENTQDDGGVSLSIDHPQKLLLIGTSKDFGHCRSRRKDGKPCSMIVNTAVSETCQYHVQNEYKKSSGKRPDLQSSYSGVQPKVFKKKLGTNIIYGGQSYNPMSASVIGAGTKSGEKPKKKVQKLALQSLGVKGSKEIEQEARDSVLTLHGRKNKEDTLVKVAGASEPFKELLSAPSFGSQNLIRHMVKVEEVSKSVSTITAKDLLQQHRQEMKVKQATRKTSLDYPSTTTTTSTRTLKDKNGTQAVRKDSKEKLGSTGPSFQKNVENLIPVLGRDCHDDDGDDEYIIFDEESPEPKVPWKCVPSFKSSKTSSSVDAKRKAIALIRSKGQITKADPNKVVGKSTSPMSPRKREAVKRRVEDDLNRSQEEESSGDSGQPAKKLKKSFLGQEVDLSQDELKSIMDAKSSNSGVLAEVQAEMEEIYFQALEKKERLENQMASIREKKCKVVSCKKCDYTWFGPSSLCKAENHQLARHEATMRYFNCKTCKSRSITFNRIPNKSCRSCGGTSYERTSMLKERKGPLLDSEKLLLRGEERKWVM